VKKLFFILFITGSFWTELQAIPPWISVEERAEQSDAVILVNVKKAEVLTFTQASSLVHLNWEVLEVKKGNFDRNSTGLTFFIFPGRMENRLSIVPQNGHYLVFLQYQEIMDKDKKVRVLLPYSPSVFAFHLLDSTKGE
jgi:hypothetical protein